MYQVIATDDFVDVIKELSLRHVNVLTKSFISIERINDEEIKYKDSFLESLLNQIKNQELE